MKSIFSSFFVYILCFSSFLLEPPAARAGIFDKVLVAGARAIMGKPAPKNTSDDAAKVPPTNLDDLDEVTADESALHFEPWVSTERLEFDETEVKTPFLQRLEEEQKATAAREEAERAVMAERLAQLAQEASATTVAQPISAAPKATQNEPKLPRNVFPGTPLNIEVTLDWAANFSIAMGSGALEIVPGTENKLKLTATVEDEAGASVVFSPVPDSHDKARIRASGAAVNLRLEIPPAYLKDFKVITVDASVKLSGFKDGASRVAIFETAQGSINISGLSALDGILIKNADGATTVNDMNGVAKMSSSRGDFTVKNHVGGLIVLSVNGKITVLKHQDNVIARSENSDTTVALNTGETTLSSGKGRAWAKGCKGKCVSSTVSGTVYLDGNEGHQYADVKIGNFIAQGNWGGNLIAELESAQAKITGQRDGHVRVTITDGNVVLDNAGASTEYVKKIPGGSAKVEGLRNWAGHSLPMFGLSTCSRILTGEIFPKRLIHF